MMGCNYESEVQIYVGDVIARMKSDKEMSTKTIFKFENDMVTNEKLNQFKPKIEPIVKEFLNKESKINIADKEMNIVTTLPIVTVPDSSKVFMVAINKYYNVCLISNKRLMNIVNDRVNDIEFNLGFKNGAFTFIISNDLRKKVKVELLCDSFVDGKPMRARSTFDLKHRDSVKIRVGDVMNYIINQGGLIKVVDFADDLDKKS